MTLSKYINIWMVSFMFLKGKKFKYTSGILLFIFVFIIGFVKMNIVYSSTGIGSSVSTQKIEFYEDDDSIDTFSDIKDNTFIRIYKEDYGFDVVLNMFNEEKTFSLKLPWKNN